jgi:hypothetical protein
MTMSVIIRQLDGPLPRPSLTATNIVATPGGQTDATPLPAQRNIVKNVAPGAGVIIQLLPIGQQTVFNRCGTGVELTVFPIVGMKIEGNGTNVPQTIADGDQVTFTWDGSVTWLVS